MVTKAWKVYGAEGHRQKISFGKSVKYDWSDKNLGTRLVEFINSDVTNTNDYTIMKITRDNAEQCDREASGQVTDGMFENCRIGDVVEIPVNECPIW